MKHLFHTITIKLPAELVYQNKKTGEIKLIPTLLKSGGLTKRNGKPSIILEKDNYIVHPVIKESKPIDYEAMKKEEAEKKKALKASKKDIYDFHKQSKDVQLKFINKYSNEIKNKMLGKFTTEKLGRILTDYYKLIKKGNTEDKYLKFCIKYNLDHPSRQQIKNKKEKEPKVKEQKIIKIPKRRKRELTDEEIIDREIENLNEPDDIDNYKPSKERLAVDAALRKAGLIK